MCDPTRKKGGQGDLGDLRLVRPEDVAAHENAVRLFFFLTSVVSHAFVPQEGHAGAATVSPVFPALTFCAERDAKVPPVPLAPLRPRLVQRRGRGQVAVETDAERVVCRLAESLMRKHDLVGFPGQVRQRGAWLGSHHRGPRTIRLARRHVAIDPRDEVRDATPHGIAHAIFDCCEGRTPFRKAKAAEVGARFAAPAAGLFDKVLQELCRRLQLVAAVVDSPRPSLRARQGLGREA